MNFRQELLNRKLRVTGTLGMNFWTGKGDRNFRQEILHRNLRTVTLGQAPKDRNFRTKTSG